MSEDIRHDFLISTRGHQGAADWYVDAYKIYLRAGTRAMWSKENLGNLNVARGKEWASKYLLAAQDCLDRAGSLRQK